SAGDSSRALTSDVGCVLREFVFRGAGFGFAGPRTTATALLTYVKTANLADADELTIASPKASDISKISRARVEVESEYMGALL
ncbi:MAG TPA: hypothetical protein VJM12_11835, partial [Pyrinomonadaceae bacterium]|nr:hypothetical protein [Pyrinomonadaceae bacterium]